MAFAWRRLRVIDIDEQPHLCLEDYDIDIHAFCTKSLHVRFPDGTVEEIQPKLFSAVRRGHHSGKTADTLYLVYFDWFALPYKLHGLEIDLPVEELQFDENEILDLPEREKEKDIWDFDGDPPSTSVPEGESYPEEGTYEVSLTVKE